MEFINERYPEMMFYVNGARKQFVAGKYQTEDKDEIAVLERLAEVKSVTKPKAVKPATKATKAKASK